MRDPDKIHRILDVQRQLHRIEEWRLADLERSLRDLAATEHELIRALNEDDALQGLFIDATARRLASIAEEATRVGEERMVQEQRLMEEAARKVCAEHLVQAVDREMAQAADKRALIDAIERFIAPAAQASRKIAGP
jgi:septal ring factor EnvC (AmiA/AmiB activator)